MSKETKNILTAFNYDAELMTKKFIEGFKVTKNAFIVWHKELRYGGYHLRLYEMLGCRRTLCPWNCDYYLEGEEWKEIPF